MADAFRAIRITDRVWWVGAIDWDLRNFHGYLTSRGSTYNAYLIVADEITLVDTVKAPFCEEMLARIASVVDPAEIRNIISNHAEMDHSGSLPAVIERVNPERVLASAKGAEALRQHFHFDREIEVVPDGERRELGGAHLRFFEARMLHWPDSMFTFLEDEGVLFSNDGFGMHLASEKRFADELDPGLVRYEAAKYYANILLPVGKVVSGALKKMAPLRPEVRLIAPDHGPVWREDPGQILDLSATWTLQRPSRKVVVTYAPLWQSTALMARAVAEGLGAGGAEVKLMPLNGSHRSDVAVELLEAGALVVGSPTLNGQIYPTVADVMTYLKGLKPKNLIGASFGSFGWSGDAVRQLDGLLTEMGVELVGEGLQVQYVPDEQALLRCRALGSEIATKLRERVSAAIS